MRATVLIRPKAGILDPQGQTVERALPALGFAGVGLEYRVVPNKVGLFIDARWNYYGDRYGSDNQNNFTSRAGVRWVF